MEKRNFFRLMLSEKMEFSILNPETAEVISSPIKGVLKDLSGGGLSFTTEADLEVNQLLEIKIYNMDKLFLLLGKIVRIASKTKDLYAVEFVHLDSHTQDQLVKLIFNMQQAQRRKMEVASNGHE